MPLPLHQGRAESLYLHCDSCDYKTNRVGRLERHKRTHSGEKPFACQYCSYRAAQRATLARHILTHTGTAPLTISLRPPSLSLHPPSLSLHPPSLPFCSLHLSYFFVYLISSFSLLHLFYHRFPVYLNPHIPLYWNSSM